MNKEFTDSLKAMGIATIEVEYSGSCDSGEVDNATCYGSDGKQPVMLEVATQKAVEEWAWEIMLAAVTSEGWWNNAGGWGSFQIDVANERVSYKEHCIRIEDAETEICDEEFTFAELGERQKENDKLRQEWNERIRSLLNLPNPEQGEAE